MKGLVDKIKNTTIFVYKRSSTLTLMLGFLKHS